MTWEDVTRSNGEFRESRARCGAFGLVIHYYVGCGKTLFFSVHPGPIDKVELKAKKLSEAKREAGSMFRKMLSDATVGLEA